MLPRSAFPTTLALALLAGCVDELPVDVEDAPPIERAEGMALAQDEDFELVGNHRARLEVSFTVHGALVPNTPITANLEGVAIERILGGTVEVRLPTQAEMALAGPGKRLARIPTDKPPVVAQWQLPPMQQGDVWKGSVEVGSFVEKGYYQVTAVTNTVGDFESPYVNDNAFREAWLFITDRGGQVTNFLDHSIFPDRIVPQPGPFEAWGLASASSSANQTAASMAAGASGTFSLYFNTDSAQNKEIPMRRAEYRASYIEGGRVVTRRTGTVPHDGIVELPCADSDQYVGGLVWVPTTSQVNANFSLAHFQVRHNQCGDEEIPVHGARFYYLPWVYLNYAIPEIEGHTRHYRSPANFKWENRSGSTVYRRSNDMIIYRPQGMDRHWTSAHEFGHALHHKELGGLWNSNCPSPHYVDEVSNYKCALQEGIADYLGDIGSPRPGYGGWESFHEAAPSHRAEAEIEGNVAALFHDLIDDTGESGDEVELRARDVMRVFKSCRTSDGKRDNIGAFVWCMEDRFDLSIHQRHFPHLNSQRNPSSTRPSNWNANDIRTTWIKNIGN